MRRREKLQVCLLDATGETRGPGGQTDGTARVRSDKEEVSWEGGFG